ncbi:hypothetical protein WJ978_01555 [Achromobacter xylosoxidans]
MAQVTGVRAALASPGGERPADGAAWRSVALPDNWESRWPGHTGFVWYRIDWRHGCGGKPAGQAALAVESIVMAGEIYLNDDLLWRDASQVEPLSRSWNMPRYWRLPESSLRDGANTVWIRVAGVAGQTLASARSTWASRKRWRANTTCAGGATARCSWSTW